MALLAVKHACALEFAGFPSLKWVALAGWIGVALAAGRSFRARKPTRRLVLALIGVPLALHTAVSPWPYELRAIAMRLPAPEGGKTADSYAIMNIPGPMASGGVRYLYPPSADMEVLIRAEADNLARAGWKVERIDLVPMLGLGRWELVASRPGLRLSAFSGRFRDTRNLESVSDTSAPVHLAIGLSWPWPRPAP